MKYLCQEVSTLRQRQQNNHLIVRNDISVAYVTNNKRLRSALCHVLLQLIADRHEASRGLFAIAELLDVVNRLEYFVVVSFKSKSSWSCMPRSSYTLSARICFT